MCVCMYVYVCMYVCMYVYVCVYVYVCMYMYVVTAGIKAGIDIDAFAPRLSFFWGIGMNFYMVSNHRMMQGNMQGRYT